MGVRRVKLTINDVPTTIGIGLEDNINLVSFPAAEYTFLDYIEGCYHDGTAMYSYHGVVIETLMISSDTAPSYSIKWIR